VIDLPKAHPVGWKPTIRVNFDLNTLNNSFIPTIVNNLNKDDFLDTIKIYGTHTHYVDSTLAHNRSKARHVQIKMS
jgi:hypothetical protein